MRVNLTHGAYPYAGSGEWFDLEIIARGKHFQTFVNGKQVLDWTDRAPKNVTEGERRLYILGKYAELHVEKIEVKELPPQPLSGALRFDGAAQHVDIPEDCDSGASVGNAAHWTTRTRISIVKGLRTSMARLQLHGT